ncbi:MAG: L,D-transpeptidase family protein [Thermoleophilaceae bacterium]
MRQRSFIVVAVVVAALIAGAIGAYAYDSSRDDLIAKGVTVAGVDVGGLKAPAARRVVRRQVAARLERPLAVAYGKRRFRLSVRRAALRADVEGMVDDALRESRSGNIIGRVARDLTGGEEDAQVPARLSYSRAAVGHLERRVRRSLNRPAQDATLNFPSLSKVKEHNGITVREAALHQRIGQALTVPGVSRRVRAPVRITRPKVTRAQLASRYPKLIVIDRNAFQLRYYRHLRLVKAYSIAVGQQGLETPAGLHHIQDKQVNPSWHVPNSSWAGSLAGRVIPPGPDDPIKARWMGIIDGSGIHGTDEVGSLGSAASHGCIRMSIPEVEELYDKVAVGTPVYVA